MLDGLEAQGLVFVLGLVLLVGGLVTPSTTTETARVCIDGDEYCSDREAITVQREVENERKEPMMIVGGVLMVLGLVNNPQNRDVVSFESSEGGERYHGSSPYNEEQDRRDRTRE